MPQKPQARAKNKRRLTKRLEKWRAKQDQPVATQAAAPKEVKAAAPAPAKPKEAKAPAKEAKAPAKPKA